MKFNELSAIAKVKALANVKEEYENNWSDFYAQDVLDSFEEKLQAMGYTDIQFYYNLSYSQGAGACFTGNVYITEFLSHHKATNKYRALWYADREGWFGGCEIYKSDTYYDHFNTININPQHSYYVSDKVNKQMADFESWALSVTKDLSKELYRLLCESYEYIWDDSNLLEYAGNFEFNEKGKIVF